MVTTPGEPDLTISYNDDGSRRNEVYDGGAGLHRAYYYDGLGRPAGLTTISTVNGFNEIVTDVGSCQYDPLGRQVRACNYRGLGLGLDGENILRAGGWSIVSGPGLDDPLVGLVRGAVGRNIELFYVTDGQGRHLAAGEATGTVDAGLFNAGPTGEYAGWDATGAASVAQSYGANRLSTADAPGLAFYRNRIYDQTTGRWTQEDPLGMAGGLNLYQFNGNDPVSYSDPFGLKVCFRGNTPAENTKLRQTAEQATDTKIKVDSRNCVKKVTFQGSKNESLAVLADNFINLVKSDELYTVKFTPEADSPQHNTHVINIAYMAEGLAYATMVNGTCVDNQRAYSFPQVFAHELFHHRTVPFTGKMDGNENNSVAAENVYNDFAGRPRRCKY
ncbi:MAG TPA: RHS repeat-associated core domain-containing protein [Candidatus Tectomicrobia bacterium]|nr:RHS repeat-associated core domain-containing protein [Candidatus Tectomicrobia bacterium]